MGTHTRPPCWPAPCPPARPPPVCPLPCLPARPFAPPPLQPTDKYGRYGRGRLVRIAAGKLQQALEGKELEVVMEGDEEGDEEGSEEATTAVAAPAAAAKTAAPGGKKPPPADNFGRYGRGRLVRIAAHKMKAVTTTRGAEKRQALKRMSMVVGASGVDLTTSQEMILAGNVKFNPVLVSQSAHPRSLFRTCIFLLFPICAVCCMHAPHAL